VDDQFLCPVGGAALGVQFQWNSVSDPSGIQKYELYLEAIERNPYVYPLQSSTTEFLNTLVPCAEVYRWRVRAVDNAGNVGDWSQERSFSVRDVTGPPAPTLVEPAQGADVPCPADPVTIALRWNAVNDLSGVAGYFLELEPVVEGTPPAPTPMPVNVGPVTGTEFGNSLGCGWSYRWRVRALDSADNLGEWSGWSEFRVATPTP
jgi:hypothetical protein